MTEENKLLDFVDKLETWASKVGVCFNVQKEYVGSEYFLPAEEKKQHMASSKWFSYCISNKHLSPGIRLTSIKIALLEKVVTILKKYEIEHKTTFQLEKVPYYRKTANFNTVFTFLKKTYPTLTESELLNDKSIYMKTLLVRPEPKIVETTVQDVRFTLYPDFPEGSHSVKYQKAIEEITSLA